MWEFKLNKKYSKLNNIKGKARNNYEIVTGFLCFLKGGKI